MIKMESLLRKKIKCSECQKEKSGVRNLRNHMKSLHVRARTCFPPNRVFPPGGSWGLELLDANDCSEVGPSAGGCLAWRQGSVERERLKEMAVAKVEGLVDLNGDLKPLLLKGREGRLEDDFKEVDDSRDEVELPDALSS